MYSITKAVFKLLTKLTGIQVDEVQCLSFWCPCAVVLDLTQATVKAVHSPLPHGRIEHKTLIALPFDAFPLYSHTVAHVLLTDSRITPFPGTFSSRISVTSTN
jgi:hypothetical protein